MIILARQNQSTILQNDNQSLDGDGATRLVHLTSTHTTPSGSKRWMRVFSNSESDGFDSFYGKSELNVSFKRYMDFPGEGDTISYTTMEETLVSPLMVTVSWKMKILPNQIVEVTKRH
ncbi:RING/U-box superfamily protein [Forsythia ovata]|uniref:RING/U-box superfamily protein n=1 Tax=Forsythia ovata TaxID=205694 RepID=A0ABD1WVC1_9LAMI